MKKLHVLYVALVTLILALFATSNVSATPGALKWTFTATSSVYSTPAIGLDGTVYFLDQSNLYAINPTTGTSNWTFPVTNSGGLYVVGLSSPAIGRDGTIYFGTGDGHFYAVNTNGIQKWVYSLPNGDSVDCTPAIGPDETIYFNAQGDPDPIFYALSTDGNLRPGFPLFTGYLGINGTPSSATVGLDGTIYQVFPIESGDIGDPYAGIGKIIAIRADGTTLWTNGLPQISGDGSVEATSPSIGADGTIYAGTADGRLVAFNSDPYALSASRINWVFIATNTTGFNGSALSSCPVISTNNSTLFLGSESDQLFAVNADGTSNAVTIIQPNATGYGGDGMLAAPAIASDGTVYAATTLAYEHSGPSTISGYLASLSSDFSTLNWSNAVDESYGYYVDSSPTIGADGTVYMGSSSGNVLYAFEGTAGPATNSSCWPTWRKDSRLTGCAAAPVTMIDIQFGSSDSAQMEGIAAAGIFSTDYWNLVAGDKPADAVTSGPLFDVASNATTVTVSWDEAEGLGSSSGPANYVLLNSSIADVDTASINMTVSNLTAGTYDFYFYGYGGTNYFHLTPVSMLNTTFTFVSGATNPISPASQSTSTNLYDRNVMVQGNQYVAFWGVQVTNSTTPVVINASAFGSPFVNGMQIVKHN